MNKIDSKKYLEDIYFKHHADSNRYGFLYGGKQRGEILSKFIGKGKKILDLGCRDGAMTKFYTDGNEVIGVDIDRTALELCSNNLGIKTVWVDFNSESLPFESQNFDIVIAGELLEHLYHPELLIREVHRVLVKKGLFLGSVPNAFHLKNRFLFLIGKNFEDEMHFHQFSRKKIKTLLSNMFSETEIIPLGGRILPIFPMWFSKRLVANMPSWFCRDWIFKAVK
jgi:2-polyprenyl-3-methyl-5-hydroxy-6-metoxy-1,4-benzoquinol methylase